MTKSPIPFAFNAGPKPRGLKGPVYAYAKDSSGVWRIIEAMQRFSLTPSEMAELLGVKPEACTIINKDSSPEMLPRLDVVLTVLERVRPWTTTDQEAVDWYRHEPIPALGNMTAAEAVNAGHFSALSSYIDHIAVGGFA